MKLRIGELEYRWRWHPCDLCGSRSSSRIVLLFDDGLVVVCTRRELCDRRRRLGRAERLRRRRDRPLGATVLVDTDPSRSG